MAKAIQRNAIQNHCFVDGSSRRIEVSIAFGGSGPNKMQRIDRRLQPAASPEKTQEKILPS
jgi:hypothetical protein